MNKYFLTIMLAISALTSTQAETRADNENPGGWDFELPVGKNKQPQKATQKATFSLRSGLSFGFIGGTNQAEDVDIDMGQSYEIEWSNIISVKRRIGNRDFLRIGLGMDWRNYRVTGFKMFSKDERGVISMQDYPEGTEPGFSRIHTFSLSIPLKYYHYLSKSVYFAIGPELYLTPYASLKTRYYEKGKERQLTKGNVHNNCFSAGIGAEIGFSHVGLYYKYDPFNVLRSDFGPHFSSMTVGLKVSF